MKFENIKKYLPVAAIILVLILILSQCSGSKKSVAIDFVEALFVDVDAKKVVSLMSDDLLAEIMESTGSETKKVLISNLEKKLEASMEDFEKAKVKYIDEQKIDSSTSEVYLELTYTKSGGLFGLDSDTDTDSVTITLVKEGGKWRVDDF